MEPTKVKVYGFISLTKTTYVKIQTVVFLILTLALIFSLAWGTPARLAESVFWGNLTLITVIVLILEALETYFTLRKC